MMSLKSKVKVFLMLMAVLIAISLGVSPISYSQEATPSAENEQPATETPDRPTINLNNSFYSHYIWRGYELSHNSFVMFPTVTITYKGFSLNWWGDIDTDYAGEPEGFQCWEQDYLAWYSNSWKKLNYTIGYIYYNTKNHAHWDTQEMWVSLGLNTLLSPTLSVWYDIEDSGSWYYNLAVSHSIPISKERVCWKNDLSLDLGGSVAYYWQDDWTKVKVNYSAWHDGHIWAGLNIPLTDVCSITPKIEYSFPLSHKANDNIKAASFDGNDSQFVYGGLILDYNF